MSDKIRLLNDVFRKTGIGGLVTVTRHVLTLPEGIQKKLLAEIKTFSDFNEDNDPYGEHDFGTVVLEKEKFFWKIDYYNQDLSEGSEDPSNPAKTKRVLTVMHSSEY